MREVKHFIAGKSTIGHSTREGEIFNPNTGQVQASVCLGGADDIAAAVEAAKKCNPNGPPPIRNGAPASCLNSSNCWKIIWMSWRRFSHPSMAR